MWKTFLALAGLLLLVFLGREVTAARKDAFSQAFTFTPGSGEPSFVTSPFRLEGSASTVRVGLDTDLANNWLYFNLTLIETETGTAYDFGEEVSYYAGHDSDGDWTEGSRLGEVEVPAVPPGQYYLRVEPEGEEKGTTPVHYTLTVVRDVVTWWPYVVAFVLLVVPPIVSSVRAMTFEGRRWAESDHASSSSDDDDDDSSDDD
jgi:hypothetical protein